MAICELLNHPFGWELRVNVSGELVRSQVCRASRDAVLMSAEWREAFLAKGGHSQEAVPEMARLIDAVAARLLADCKRHCCLCLRWCGQRMQIHHIVPDSQDGAGDYDNGIPFAWIVTLKSKAEATWAALHA